MHHQHRTTGHARLVNRKRGPVWYARVRTVEWRDGVPKRVQRNTVLGPAWTRRGRPEEGYLTEATANRALLALLGEAEEKAGKPQAAAGITFAQAADAWLTYAEEDGCRQNTLRDYRTTARKLKQRFGDALLTEITPQDVEAYKAQVKATGVSARTVNRHLVILGGIFNRAEATWGITHNPAAAKRVKRLREPAYTNGRIAFLTPVEVEALVRATEDEQDKALYLTAAMTGLRQGELLALTWKEVDHQGERVHVRTSYDQAAKEMKPPKSGRVRSVPMAPNVATALAALRNRDRFTADNDLVFPDWTGEPQHHMELRARFYAALTRAGLKRIRFHDLRHTFGTVAAAAGRPITSIQAWMGHAHVSTTMVYAHYSPAKDEAALLGQAFQAESAPPARDSVTVAA